MARRKVLTDKMVAKLKPRVKRWTLADPGLACHYVRVTPVGARSYVVAVRDPINGKQVWKTIGSADVMSLAEARKRARVAIQRIRDGLPAFEPPAPAPDSFKVVAENYLARHVRAKGLRTETEIARILRKYCYPVLQHREFESIRRSDVTNVLDLVEDGHGTRQADCVLGVLRAVMHWHAARVDDYNVPIIRGMARGDRHSAKRARILNDDEIRTVWAVASGNGLFGAFIKLALLTGQRRAKIASMRWEDVSVDGTWDIPSEEREKGNAGALVLPEVAVGVIRTQTRIVGNPFIFPGRGDRHFSGYGQLKLSFDAKAKIAPWVIHDLRRTARSLMARAGVRPDIAERVMGHVLPGVEGIYDRHEYRKEKADALKRLAGLIALVLDPPTENVTPLHGEV